MFRSGAERSMSPDISDRLERTSCRKPEEIDTATIITKKLTAMHDTAIFPLKRSFDAMKSEASIKILFCQSLEASLRLQLILVRSMLDHHLEILLLQLDILLLLCSKDTVSDCSHIVRM